MAGPLSSQRPSRDKILTGGNVWGKVNAMDAEARRAKPKTGGDVRVGTGVPRPSGLGITASGNLRKRLRK